jgi:protein tyrosine phosphatase (PTP) superfamily phosphohydrolase (DUF442 family)
MMRLNGILPGLVVFAATAASAVELAGIPAYVEYSPTFSSSGQPTAAQLQLLKEKGFQRIAYIAYTDHEKSLPAEDRLVKELGMDYLQVPVDWNAPAKSDFYLFAGAVQKEPSKRTLLHCQVNYRASAFAFLYRVVYDDVPIAKAKRDLNQIWKPNETWRKLIFDVLEENGRSPDCDDCDWGE